MGRNRFLALILVLLAAWVAWWTLHPGSAEAPRAGEPVSENTEPVADPQKDSRHGSARKPRRTAPVETASEPFAEILPPSPRIRVLTEDGRPVLGAGIVQHPSGHDAGTDGNGIAVLDWLLEPDGSTVRVIDTDPSILARVDAHETTVRIATGLPLHVRLTDTETARERDDPVGLSVGRSPGVTLPSPHTVVVFASAGQFLHASAWVPGIRGNRAQPLLGGHTVVSPFATRLELTVPLFPEASVALDVRTPSDNPATGARVTAVEMGGHDLWFDADPTDTNGRTVLHGLPAIQFERIALWVVHDDGAARVEGVLLVAGPDSVAVNLVAQNEDVFIRDEEIEDHNETDNDMEFEEEVEPHPRGDPERAELFVRVTRRDGAPAPGVLVQLADRDSAVTGTRGVARFSEQFGGAVEVIVSAPGWVTTTARAVMASGEAVRMDVQETHGRTIRVRVLDHEQQPVAFARIRVRRKQESRYAKVVDGVQIIALHTDREGWLELPDLATEKIILRAEYGSRAVETRWNGDPEVVLTLLPPH